MLVATVFDAFQRVYNYQTRDLVRIASNGTGILPEGNISRDLVHRLAEEASEIAEHLLQIPTATANCASISIFCIALVHEHESFGQDLHVPAQ